MELKKLTVEDLPRYVMKNSCLLDMLRQIKVGGRKAFLLTNSDWWYTQIIMKYLLNDETSSEGIFFCANSTVFVCHHYKKWKP